jgi:hypothetical protein
MADNILNLTPDTGGLYACFTVDDVVAGDGARLESLLDWLDDQQLKATLFVIPYSYANQAPIYEDNQLMGALGRAVEAGHECYPHGYDHEMFECGVPDLMAVADDEMMRTIARTMSREFFQLRHAHTRGALGARFRLTQQIWQVAFGEQQPAGFRGGYHAFCPELYQALGDLKVKWSSTRTATPGAWRPTVTADADEVVRWVGLHPYWVDRVLEIPHLADYGSHLDPADVEQWVALARRHLTICTEQAAPFISVANRHGLSGKGNAPDWHDVGFRSYERIVALARDEFGATFVPMSVVANAALERPEVWPRREEYRR